MRIDCTIPAFSTIFAHMMPHLDNSFSYEIKPKGFLALYDNKMKEVSYMDSTTKSW